MHNTRRLTDKQKKIVSKTHNQSQFIKFIANMSEWEYKVFYAFYPRMRIDVINPTSKTGISYQLFLDSEHDELAQKLVGHKLLKYRPAGISTFAELLKINTLRDDDAVTNAIDKASSISLSDFRKEYPNSKTSPLDILKTILLADYSIELSPKNKTESKVYDALREEDE